MSQVDNETGIWSLEIARKRHKHDLLLVAAIASFYDPPEKAVDIGCGDGWYCKMLKDYGWPVVHGYDGTKDVTTLGIYDDINFIDLTKSRQIGIDYDFALCIEVGEHIPEKHGQVFLDNISRFSNKHLVMSWAVPGQYSASGHVNNKPNEYVIEELSKRGLKFDRGMSEVLRLHSFLKWLKNTVMAFRRN